MASSGSQCTGCLKYAVEIDEGRIVCTECGKLFHDKDVLKEEDWPRAGKDVPLDGGKLFQGNYTSVPKGIARSLPFKRMSDAKKSGIRTVEMLAANYKMRGEMKEEVMLLYQSTDESYLRSSRAKKIILAGICAYVVMLKNRWAVALNHICNSIGCDKKDFGHNYMSFLGRFPEHNPGLKPIDELVPSVLREASFDELEQQAINNRVIELICLQKECLLIESRSPIHIIFGTSFLAWKSLNPCQRTKVTTSAFSSRFKVPFNSSAVIRSKELIDFLISLASKIPWLESADITKKNIALFVDDILKNSSSLLYDRSCEQALRDEEQEEAPVTLNHKRAPDFDQFDDSKDPEISDSDIDQYILSRNEVKVMKKLKKIQQQRESSI